MTTVLVTGIAAAPALWHDLPAKYRTANVPHSMKAVKQVEL
jgi:hypothetical protein